MSLDHLVASINADNEITLNIVHYFLQDIKITTPNFEQLNYYDTDNFHGFITKYDLNKNIIAVDRFINGIKSQGKFTIRDKKKSDLLSRANEDCIQVTEEFKTEYCIFWYNPDTFGDVEIIMCNTDTQTITYEDCSGSSGDSSGGGATVITINEYVEILNNLTGKAKCVFEKLKNSSIGFKNAIKKFDGDFPVSHLKLELGNTGSSRATTIAPNSNAGSPNSPNYVITIRLNNNSTNQGVGYRPNLMTAKTIAHEVIHAEMYRKLLSILDNGGTITGVTKTDLISKLSNGDYPGIYDFYMKYKNWQHQQMATHYRESIADVLKDFDSSQHSDQFYMDIAWEGLIYENSPNAISTWINQTVTEKERIKKVISDYIDANKNETCQ